MCVSSYKDRWTGLTQDLSESHFFGPLQRLQVVQRTAGRQAGKMRALESEYTEASKRQKRLTERLGRVERLHANLHERLQLLTELHWSLPHPLGAAEKDFRDRELPGLERAHAQLQRDAADARQRVAALRAAPRSGAGGPSAAVPPAQLRRVREALALQAEVVAASLESLSLMESAVLDAGMQV
jgi:hypothetical protein